MHTTMRWRNRAGRCAARPARRLNRSLTQLAARTTIRSRLPAPVVTFTFDDFPQSAWSVGGRILERHNARATYFLSAKFCGQMISGVRYYDQDDLKAIHANGHELANHTAHHSHLPELSAPAISEEVTENAAFLYQIEPDVRMVSFAYPYGSVTPRVKRIVARHVPISRGVWPGINHRRIDLGLIKTICLKPRSAGTGGSVAQWLAKAERTNGWLVFHTHDVAAKPRPYGVTPEALEAIVRQVVDAGIQILPMKNAVGLIAHSARKRPLRMIRRPVGQ